ncbi:hypothetical protein B0H67DRAFT_646899 [Lasiosphaeris hirsuta]|uniref:Spp2/MOS2 G-patch domain-containing protein n=1 Tax=Lasiosphaeris hirsuta TaxID=260670 RepID=A0AA40A929_9PEZI|nr:hypothetical protein B0H67DRAFT_646899 [Lasiosphaeris hirsuta]
MSDQDAKSSRVKIHFGASSSSALSIKKRARPEHGKRHRAHALHDDSSDSGEDADQVNNGPRHEAISTYGLSGAGDDEEEHKRAHHSDRHGKSGRRHATRDRKRGDSRERGRREDRKDGGKEASQASLETQDKPAKWGLTINMKGAGASKDKKTVKRDSAEPEGDLAKNGKRVRDVDDEALDALMGAEAPKKSKRGSNDPDREPQLEDYEAVPIDDFGATLLKSFGWDGKLRGKVKEVNKHANLTGLGAKDVKGAEELTAWNQKSTKDSRPVRLDDYQRGERQKRQRLADQYGDTYKRERDRERDRERRDR